MRRRRILNPAGRVLTLKFPLLLLPYFATFVPAHADLLAIDTDTSENQVFSAVAGVMRDRIGDFSVGVTGHGHAYDEATTWGGSFEGWSGDHTSLGNGDPHIFGLESSVIAQNPDSFSVKAPLFTTFKTRRDGIDLVLSPEQYPNAFNYNSSQRVADAQRRDANGSEAAAKIACPQQVILAAKDRMTPHKAGMKLVETLPNPEYHLIENSGHMIPLEAPDECRSLLRQFIFANNPAT